MKVILELKKTNNKTFDSKFERNVLLFPQQKCGAAIY